MGVSTGFGLNNVEKCFENAFGNDGSAFPNLRIGEHGFVCRVFNMIA
jgi:hypothetical protein